jgi:glycosyltransferase involved in cell wall biosynthesis
LNVAPLPPSRATMNGMKEIRLSQVSNMPVVDVGIPAYVRAKFIAEAIESVLDQTFTEWRLTVSDDGAGGGDVAAAVEPYLGDPRVRYLPTGDRLGEAGNWNRVVELAEAPYLAILHDDDRWHREFLGRRVAFMDAHPQCSFVYSGINRVQEDGKLLSRWSPSIAEGLHPSEEFVPRLLETNVVGPTVSVLARRAALLAAGLFDDRLAHLDYEMWFRLACRSPVGYLGGWDADYRIHGQSTTLLLTSAGTARALELPERLIEVADREAPGLLTRRSRRRLRANVLLEEISFNALGAGHKRFASTLLLHAIASYPPALLDRRVVDWIRIAVGPRLRRRIARARTAFSSARATSFAS